MGARQKLNSIYLGSAAIVSGFAALMFKSTTVFIICLATLIAALFHDGSVRLHGNKRR